MAVVWSIGCAMWFKNQNYFLHALYFVIDRAQNLLEVSWRLNQKYYYDRKTTVSQYLQITTSAIFQIFQKGWNDGWPTLKTSWKHLLKSLGCPLVIYMCAQCFWRFRVRAKHSPFSLQAISFWTITVWPCLKAQRKYIWSLSRKCMVLFKNPFKLS